MPYLTLTDTSAPRPPRRPLPDGNIQSLASGRFNIRPRLTAIRRTLARLGVTNALCVLLVFGLPTGCQSEQLRQDQHEMRQILLDLYERQVFDNLVRANNHRAILHVDYSKLTGTVDTILAAGATAGQDVTRNHFAGATTSATSVLKNAYGANGSVTNKNSLAITGDPVLLPQVYKEYLDYLANHQLSKVKSQPKPEDEHIGGWYGQDYYYVPHDDSKAFFDLYLRTTVQRAQPVSAPKTITTRVKGAQVPHLVPGTTNVYRIQLRFADPVLNDAGFIHVTIKGFEYTFGLTRLVDQPLRKPTTQLLLIYDEGETEGPRLPVNDFIAALQNQKVDIEQIAPTPPPVESGVDVLKDIENELRLDRLNRF